jgi:hypothetical protein
LIEVYALTLGIARPPIDGRPAGSDPDRQFADLAAKAVSAGIFPAEFGIEDLHRIIDLFAACDEAAEQYRLPAYDGSLTLIVADDEPQHELGPDLGWGAVAGIRLDVQRLPGTHLTIVRPPHVGELARQMRRRLDRSGR